MTVAVVLGCLDAAGIAPAQEAAPSPPPARARRARPIHDSIDRVVDRVVAARLKPCAVAKQQGVPCFPVSLEQEGPRFSVAEALRRYRGTGAPAPGPPTSAEMLGQLSGAPQSASGGVGLDPVCAVKSLFGKLSGTTFWVYRTWDARGERPLLTDRELDPKAYAANADFRYELTAAGLLGELDDGSGFAALYSSSLAHLPGTPRGFQERPAEVPHRRRGREFPHRVREEMERRS